MSWFGFHLHFFSILLCTRAFNVRAVLKSNFFFVFDLHYEEYYIEIRSEDIPNCFAYVNKILA